MVWRITPREGTLAGTKREGGCPKEEISVKASAPAKEVKIFFSEGCARNSKYYKYLGVNIGCDQITLKSFRVLIVIYFYILYFHVLVLIH